MDVILDSNQYIADFALSSNRFSNLFDYLRRTRSTLVIPKLVLDEVVARHRDELKARTQRAEHHWNNLRQCVVSGKVRDFPSIDLDSESHALRALLRKPSKGVRIKVESDLSGVELQEVLQRGIYRKRPASNKGEELRDVALWFVVLHYAKKSREEVAFVAKDATFMEGGLVHPDLRADIQSQGVTVHVYSAIDDFIKAQAPQPAAVTPEWLERFQPKELPRIIERETKQAFRRVAGWNSYSVNHATCDDVTFVEGSLYSVGRDSTYAELTYKPVLTLHTERYVLSMPPVITTKYEPLMPTLETEVYFNPLQPPTSEVNFLGEIPVTTFMTAPFSLSFPPVPTEKKTLRVETICKLSIRVVGEKVSPVEVHEFEVTAVHDISSVIVK